MGQRETHGFRYFLMGAAAGIIGGLLLATKPGSELREDLSEYGERGRGLFRRLMDRLPARMKAAGAAGAARGAGEEAYREAREGVEERLR
ncbi:MAG: YtxH domain-containing protein [Elusimicrobia bacterium]|nr:YtxH domain-containing protein [Elusimicrobiota bacterium]